MIYDSLCRASPAWFPRYSDHQSRITAPSPRLQISSQLPPGAISTEYGSYSGPDTTELQGIAARVTAGAATPLAQAVALVRSGSLVHLRPLHLHALKPHLLDGPRPGCFRS